MANGVKEPAHRHGCCAAIRAVAQLNGREPIIPLQGHDLVLPMDGDLIVGQHPIRHGLGGPQPVPAHNQMHVGTVSGQSMGLFTGGVATPQPRPGAHGEIGVWPRRTQHKR